MIKKCKSGKWKLYSKDGSKVLGTHDTKKQAMKQEVAIRLSKHGKNDR